MPRFINDTSEDRDGGAAGLSKHAATDQQLGQKVEEGQGQGCSLQAEVFRYTGADAAMSDKQSAMSHGLLSCWPVISCCCGLCARAWVGLYRSKRSKRVGCVAAVAFQDAEVVRQIQIGVEEAVGSAAPSAFVALQTDPLTHFEFSDLLSAHKYVLEWNLYHWIASQNAGVAPSREQVCAQCPVQISVHAPAQIQEKLRKLAHGSARKQRKWLQRFRNSLGSTTWWFACPRTYFSRTAAREGNL